MVNKWLAFWDDIHDMFMGALDFFMGFVGYVVIPVMMLVLIWVFIMLLVGVA